MLPRYWTISALYCYSIKSNCDICEIAEELETLPKECKMKYTIQNLIREYGTPETYIEN